MNAEDNKAIFQKFIRELGKGNLSIFDEVCSIGIMTISDLPSRRYQMRRHLALSSLRSARG